MEDSKELKFHQMGLDDRIQHAIARLGWKEPTLVQQKAIPYFLSGKDVLARARTGTGKTGSYLIPLIQKILEAKVNYYATEQVVRALILAPTKELCRQITTNIQELTIECKRDVRCIDVSPAESTAAQKPLIEDNPDIIVGTPHRLLLHLQEENLNLKTSLQFLIIDEADLLFAFDYKEDVEMIMSYLPQIYQAFLTSATLGSEVKSLKNLVLHNPVILKLEEPALPPTAQLTQFVIKIEENDKVLLLCALFGLNLIRGKSMIYVNTVNKGYKLRLFLTQFGINSCILNSEMPAISRCHVVEEFNKGLYDTLIASDEEAVNDPLKSKKTSKSSSSVTKLDRESGVARGIDFHLVSNVINLDFPITVKSYIHRVGRCARGENEGTALSMVNIKEAHLFKRVEKGLQSLMPDTEKIFQDFKFNLGQLEGFRYRSIDAWGKCTNIAVKDVRKRELKRELLNSNKLKAYFRDHPNDLQVIEHGIPGKLMAVQSHLKNVPDYNVPAKLKKISSSAIKGKKNVKRNLSNTSANKRKRRQNDPLRSKKFSGFKK